MFIEYLSIVSNIFSFVLQQCEWIKNSQNKKVVWLIVVLLYEKKIFAVQFDFVKLRPLLCYHYVSGSVWRIDFGEKIEAIECVSEIQLNDTWHVKRTRTQWKCLVWRR